MTFGMFLGAVLTPEMLRAKCTADRGGSSATAAFTLRLSSACTEAEREAHAIPAQDLLRALTSGKGIDLAGVVIQGDLLLDELPLQKVAALRDLSPEDRRVLDGLRDEGGPRHPWAVCHQERASRGTDHQSAQSKAFC